jgi:hypothetical protein
MPKIGIGLITFAVVLQSSLAQAQTHPPGVVANEAKHAAWLELGFTSVGDYDLFLAEVDTTLLMFTFGGAFRIPELLEVGFSLPVTFASTHIDGGLLPDRDSSGFALNNPFVRLSFLLEAPRVRLRAGAGVAFPLARDDTTDGTLDDDDDFLIAGTYGPSFAHGRFDAWLWLPNRFSLVFPIRADGEEGQLVWAGEFGVGLLFDADDDEEDRPAGFTDPDETETFVQLAGEAGFRINREMVVGGRFSLWWHASNEDEDSGDDYDDVQTAFGPFFRLYGEGWFGSAALLLNLDEPDGIFGDGEGVWAFFVTAGWREE